jgi:DNA (cytosine-5)-methyltransferase 1
MKYLSLFSGIGGFELGIQQAYDNRPNIRNGNTDIQGNMSDTSEQSDRATCIGFSEIDKYAIATYQSHFPEHKNYGDITKINEQELPDFDMLVGGFPCQAFSIAGKRKGFEDTRGTLFFDIARIIKAKQPRLVFLENVKGLLSHDNGETFRTIIATLDELGYDIQWQVLNSKNHGVPQNRERVFIIGHLRGTSRPEVFPFTDNGGKNIIQLLGGSQSERVYSRKGISSTISTMQGGNLQPKVFEERRIRRLTPTECERLQGFPDQWTVGSDTQRYKQCGNAVTVNVIRDIAERLL